MFGDSPLFPSFAPVTPSPRIFSKGHYHHGQEEGVGRDGEGTEPGREGSEQHHFSVQGSQGYLNKDGQSWTNGSPVQESQSRAVL